MSIRPVVQGYDSKVSDNIETLITFPGKIDENSIFAKAFHFLYTQKYEQTEFREIVQAISNLSTIKAQIMPTNVISAYEELTKNDMAAFIKTFSPCYSYLTGGGELKSHNDKAAEEMLRVLHHLLEYVVSTTSNFYDNKNPPKPSEAQKILLRKGVIPDDIFKTFHNYHVEREGSIAPTDFREREYPFAFVFRALEELALFQNRHVSGLESLIVGTKPMGRIDVNTIERPEDITEWEQISKRANKVMSIMLEAGNEIQTQLANRFKRGMVISYGLVPGPCDATMIQWYARGDWRGKVCQKLYISNNTSADRILPMNLR